MRAYVLIKISAGDIPEVVRQMRRVKNIIEATMMFGPYDALAIVETNDLRDLGHTIASLIQPIPGVRETMTCLAVDV